MDGDQVLADEHDDRLLAWVADGDYPDLPLCIRAPTKREIEALFLLPDDEIGLAKTGELEPCIIQAIAAAVEDILSGSERARAAAKSLVRQSDPLGLMDGDGITNEQPDTNAPTEFRTAGRGEFEIVNVSTGAGRDQKADVWRAVPLVEAMIRRGQIDKQHAAAYTEAARWFYRDFVLGHRGPSVTSRYGELTSGGGTPASQQIPRYIYDRFGRAFEAPGPEDVRHSHHTDWYRACQAIGMTRCKITGNPQPTQALQWMLKLVCEDYQVMNERTPTLEDAGRAYAGYKSAKQATAAGVGLIKSGLERLVAHYGIDL